MFFVRCYGIVKYIRGKEYGFIGKRYKFRIWDFLYGGWGSSCRFVKNECSYELF